MLQRKNEELERENSNLILELERKDMRIINMEKI